jgi:hypothetical protein
MFRPAFGLLSVLALSLALSACGGSKSVVSDSAPQSKPTGVSSTPAAPVAVAAPVTATPSPAASVHATPEPTLNPIIKQAQAKPGVPVPVAPDSVKRPMTNEEFQKAMQQLPPEVRARIMGMRPMPSPSPQPAKK